MAKIIQIQRPDSTATASSTPVFPFPRVSPSGQISETGWTHNWEGVSAIDTTLFKSGEGAFRTTAPLGTGAFGARAQLPTTEDWADQSLLITLRSDNWAAVTDGYMLVWGPGTDATVQIRPSLSPLASNEWYDVPVSLSSFTGTIDWSAVTNLFFQWYSADGTQPNVWIDRVIRVPRPRRGVVSLTFDDGFATVDTIARPYLDRYSMRAAVAVMPEYVGTSGYATQEQINRLAASGWDISGHGWTPLTDLPLTEMKAELRKTRMWLADRNYKGQDVYVYPLGQQNADVRREIGTRFRHARGTVSLAQTAYATDALNSTARQVGSGITLTHVQQWIDAAAASGEWLNLVFHELRDPMVTAEDWTPTLFRAAIDYLAAANITVAPMSEVLDSLPGYQPNLPRPSYARVVHGTDATVPRPDADHVDWEGQVTPANMVDGDRYDEVAATA